MLGQISKTGVHFPIHGQVQPRAADLQAGLPGGSRWQPGGLSNKRRRTPHQMQRLEEVFNQKPNPTEAEKKKLAEELNMNARLGCGLTRLQMCDFMENDSFVSSEHNSYLGHAQRHCVLVYAGTRFADKDQQYE